MRRLPIRGSPWRPRFDFSAGIRLRNGADRVPMSVSSSTTSHPTCASDPADEVELGAHTGNLFRSGDSCSRRRSVALEVSARVHCPLSQTWSGATMKSAETRAPIRWTSSIGGPAMADQTTRLAVLGLGTMGQGMTSSALRAGISTVVWNRDLEVAHPFAERGAEVASTVAAAVQAVDVCITMVSDAKAVLSIALDLGMLEALPSGALWVQMSTIGVQATEEID